MRGSIKLAAALILGGLTVFSACKDEAPDKIVFGQAISLSGPLAESVRVTTDPIYKMWIEEVNDDGGLYIGTYDKKIPIELKQYDDKSNIETMKKNLEQLILEDKVDFLFPPFGTEFLHEAALISNKYKYILMGGAGGAIKLKEIISGLPYFFNVLNFADTQMPVLADIMEEVGVERVAILMRNDLHGVEYTATLVPELAIRDIEVVMVEAFDETDSDLEGVMAEAMMKADALEADAFLGFTYPEGSFTGAGVAMGIGYSPKLLHFNVGPCFESFAQAFGGPEAVEGIMGPGAWNEKSADGVPAFVERFKKRWGKGDEPIAMDHWGHLPYYAGLEFFQKAVEKAGSLDHDKIRDIIASETFDTTMGPVKFEKGMMLGHVGQMGQWQDGVFEVIGPEEQRTAKPLYPKPEWIEPEPGTDDDTDSGMDTGTEEDTSDPDAGDVS